MSRANEIQMEVIKYSETGKAKTEGRKSPGVSAY
jgi:hypothetical protein